VGAWLLSDDGRCGEDIGGCGGTAGCSSFSCGVDRRVWWERRQGAEVGVGSVGEGRSGGGSGAAAYIVDIIQMMTNVYEIIKDNFFRRFDH